MQRKLTVGDLFSGIGGFSLGLERTGGFETKWFVEIDDFCNRVLEKHWPHVKRYRDVREVGKHNLEPVDVISAGVPCQPVSVAGKRLGAEDDRWLWPDALRVVSEVRPTWAVFENPPGIDGMGLCEVLTDLAALGYETAPPTEIPACAVNAEHLRRRIFIVAHLGRSGTNGDSPGNVQNKVGEYQEEEQRRVKFKSRIDDDIKNVADSYSTRISRDYWNNQPIMGGRLHGIPYRMDRLRSLGNAVVPQVVEIIGRAIMAVEGVANG